MAMPWQLARAKRPKRHEPRPVAEQIAKINANDLIPFIPLNWFDYHNREGGFRWTFLRQIRLCRRQAEFTLYSQRTLTFPIKWIRTGLGKPRPAFICKCNRPVIILYFNCGNLACRRCCGAIYASQVCDKRTRPILQAKRIRTFINPLSNIGSPFPGKPKTKMWHKSYRRLRARCLSLESKARRPIGLVSKRLTERTLRPQSNYQLRMTAHWR